MLSDDFTEKGGLGAVGDFNVREGSGEAGVALEDDDPVAGRAAHELDGAEKRLRVER